MSDIANWRIEMKRPTWMNRRRVTAATAIVAAIVGVVLLAPQALAAIPHSTTGVITGCYNASGALRVIDAQNGAACAAGETQVTWNSTTISATQWSSGNITLMNRAGGAGAANVAMFQPGAALPAGSWTLSAAVLIANGLADPLTFRCWMKVRSTQGFIFGVANDWGGLGNGWHQTMTIPGLVTLTQPDWIDVYCSHDQSVGPTGVLQIESAYVLAQRVAATF
jgi:hypothetical protein